MSLEVTQWSLAVHVFGFLMWTGTMLAVVQMLLSLQKAGDAEKPPLVSLCRRMAVVMDVGATLAIASGLWLAFGQTYNPFEGGGWLHAKLTAVIVFLLVPHIWVRTKVVKHKKGEDPGKVPSVLFPVLLLVILGVIILVKVKPF